MTLSRVFVMLQIGTLLGFGVAAELSRSVVERWRWGLVIRFWLVVVACLGFWAIIWMRQRLVIAACLAAIGSICAAGWTIGYRQLQSRTIPIGETVAISGQVVEPPKVRERQQQFVIETEQFSGRPSRLLIKANREPRVSLGQRVEARGQLSWPEPTDHGFDYGHYLEGQSIVGVVEWPKELRAGDQGSPFLAGLGRLRERIVAAFYHHLPEPAASLAAGLSIGVPPDIDPDFREALRITNLTHLAAVSGQNITLSILVIFWLLRRWWLHGAIACSLSLLVGYVFLVGGEASIVRASVMAGLFLLSHLVGRPLYGFAALLVAANAIALTNPLSVTRDLGFQLSFMVLAGLILLEPSLRRILERWLPFGANYVAPVLVAALVALPVQVSNFGTLSTVGPVANLLAVPLVPVAMAGSLLLGIVDVAHSTAGQLLAYGLYLPLEGLHRLALMLSQIPFARLDLSLPTSWHTFLLGVELLAFAAIGLRGPRPALARRDAQ